MESAFPMDMLPAPIIRGKCSCFQGKIGLVSGTERSLCHGTRKKPREEFVESTSKCVHNSLAQDPVHLLVLAGIFSLYIIPLSRTFDSCTLTPHDPVVQRYRSSCALLH